MIPRNRWSIDDTVKWPEHAKRVDLAFADATLQERSFDRSITVATDRPRSVLEIRIGGLPVDTAWALGNECAALGSNGELAGFAVRLG
jgi:hypothetical protein